MLDKIAVVLLTVVLPFLLMWPVLIVGGLYARKMRKVYPNLPASSALSDPHIEKCPLCGQKIVRERFTRILPLFPYTFKVMRHYEKRHRDIGGYARRARLAVTLSLLLGIHSFAAAGMIGSLDAITPDLSLVQVTVGLLGAYAAGQLIVWIFFAYLLLHKKGSLFE